MCRIVAYGGAPISPAEMVFEAPHSLYEQSFAPRRMTSGTVNADGFGIGWIDGDTTLRYVRDVPVWQDGDAPALLGAIRTPGFLAVVRSATPGIPVTGGAQPMLEAGAAFAFNGAILPWRPAAMRALHRSLSDEAYAKLSGTGDTEALLRALGDFSAGASLAERLPEFVVKIRDRIATLGCTARLVLVVLDGDRLTAVRTAHGAPVPSLFYRQVADGCVVASEPLDDSPGWSEVPEHAALRVRNGAGHLEPLPGERTVAGSASPPPA